MLLAQRRQLRARKKELASLPAEPTVRVIELGETYAERWARSDLTTRRALLASMVKEIRVRKGRRGGRPEDRQPTRDRGDIHWRRPASPRNRQKPRPPKAGGGALWGQARRPRAPP